MSRDNDGDIKVYKDIEYTRGYMGNFITHKVEVSSLEIESTFYKGKILIEELNEPTISTFDTVKGRAIIPPLSYVGLNNKIINELDISFDFTIDLLNQVEKHTEEVKKEFTSNNMFDYRFEMEDLVGYSFLFLGIYGSKIRVNLDPIIYDALIKGLKENKITDMSLEIVYYSVFTKTDLEYSNDKNYGCIIEDPYTIEPSSFGVIKEITFKEHSKVMEVGRQDLLEKDKAAIEAKLEKISSNLFATLDSIRFNVKTGFIVLGIVVLVSLF